MKNFEHYVFYNTLINDTRFFQREAFLFAANSDSRNFSPGD